MSIAPESPVMPIGSTPLQEGWLQYMGDRIQNGAYPSSMSARRDAYFVGAAVAVDAIENGGQAAVEAELAAYIDATNARDEALYNASLPNDLTVACV